ncbi:MAG: tetratricopeptide repeat protein [Xenococcaceae cyanobacterium]
MGYPSPDRGDINDNSDITQSSNNKILGGRYQIITELGQGDYSKTYLVEDLKTLERIRYVIKHFYWQPQDEENWQGLKNYFNREIIVFQRLGTHEQIPKLIEYFEEDKVFYLVLEYIDGLSLQQEIELQNLEENRLIFLLIDVLKILDFVHNSHIIHCNINSFNLIKRQLDRKIFLVNFDFFQEIENKQRDCTLFRLRDRKKNNNNLEYFSPEQQQNRPTFASDIYALGRVAIYALTGKSSSELEDKQTNRLINWQNYCQISEKLAVILTKMTNPQLTERYQSVIEVLQDLQPLLLIDQILIGRYKIKSYLGEKSGIHTYLADNFWQQERSPCAIEQISLLKSSSRVLGDSEFSATKISENFEKIDRSIHIPKLLDRFEQNQKLYIVREYIQGKTLKQQLKQQNRLSNTKVIFLLRDVLETLDSAHKQGIIHQNIRPSNLIVRDSDGKVVLIDFGMVAEVIGNLGQTISPETKAYIPPEQMAGRANFSSDIYALGLIGIEALTGVNPQQLQRTQTEEITWLPEWKIERKLTKILDRMVSLDLGKREREARKLLEDLKAIENSSNNSKNTIKEGLNVGTKIARQKTLQFNSIARHNISILTAILRRRRFAIAAGALFLMLVREFFMPSLRPIYYIYQGETLVEKQPRQALEKFQSVIDFNPNNANAWRGRGNSLDRLRRFREALSAYDEAIRLNPKDWQAWQDKGNTLFKLEEFTGAIAAYDRVIEQQIDNSQVLNKKGKALTKLGYDREAFEIQQQVINIDPTNAEALSDLGISLIKLRRYREALIAFDKVQTLQPQQPQLWQDKGLALEYLGRLSEGTKVYNEALSIYDRNLQTQPKDLDRWIEQGNLLSRLGLYDRAIKSYHKALTIDPLASAVWQGKGNAFLALSKTDKALEAFDRALVLVPNSFNTWRDRGMTLANDRRYQDALESFDKAIAINPNDYQSWVAKGMVLNSLNRRDRSLIAFNKAAEIEPQEASVWFDRGTILARWGRVSQACDSYKKATDINPEFSSAIDASEELNCHIKGVGDRE